MRAMPKAEASHAQQQPPPQLSAAMSPSELEADGGGEAAAEGSRGGGRSWGGGPTGGRTSSKSKRRRASGGRHCRHGQLMHYGVPVISEISTVSRTGNGGSGSEGAVWQSDVNHSGSDPCAVDDRGAATTTENGTAATWLMATAAPHHATGNRGLLSDFTPEQGGLFVQPAGGDGAPMPVRGRGAVAAGAVVLPDVWFVPGLAANLVSVSQLTGLGYSVGFARGVCRVRSDGAAVVAGEARVGEDGLFALEFLRVPLDVV